MESGMDGESRVTPLTSVDLQVQFDSTPTAAVPETPSLPDEEESGTIGGVVSERVEEPDEEVGGEAGPEGDPEGEHMGVALDVIPEEGTPRGTPDLTRVGGAGEDSDEEGEDRGRRVEEECEGEGMSLVGVEEEAKKDERTGEGPPAEAASVDETVPGRTENVKGAVDIVVTPKAERDTIAADVTVTSSEKVEEQHESNLTTALVESEPAASVQVEICRVMPGDGEQASNTDPPHEGPSSIPELPVSTTISISQVLDHLEEMRDASQSPQSSLTSGNTPEPQQPGMEPGHVQQPGMQPEHVQQPGMEPRHVPGILLMYVDNAVERRRSEGDAINSLSDQRCPSPSQQIKAISASTITPRGDSPQLKRELSPTPSNDSESSSDSKPPLPPPPFNVGDKVGHVS